ncbi:MAG: hypothetical protein SFV21_15570 [Rhodospirillaceae bacterium]|nr:hypothetical protein [Rhodospirillaceae bacterium]
MSNHENTATDGPLREPTKVRRCLNCDATFNSQWSGERICPHCKSTKAWRTGLDRNSAIG